MRRAKPVPTSTVAELKDDVDAGRTGDKTPGFDPAAAPLGVDDEAAGRPADPETVARMRRIEQGRSAGGALQNAANPERAPAGGPSGGLRTAQVLWLFLLGAVALLAFGFGLIVSFR